ncbi:uncharacterized protein N7498_002812 [Penicillium cinerascens]|uniref:Uncharacterized protein n=1 Tax=Penicillium cinerascens TaxID=70096 RepID=A0A9W9NAP9_9EURO|nr:uncharacterized protein N7498_002812 [Penicillium cinerascens]KAJ5216405.1 hypothetical protein N7498_002812 [Penicillium cinerascens]
MAPLRSAIQVPSIVALPGGALIRCSFSSLPRSPHNSPVLFSSPTPHLQAGLANLAACVSRFDPCSLTLDFRNGKSTRSIGSDAGWLPPNFKPNTLKDIAVVERYWRKFCIQSNEDYVDYLLREDQAIYMNFFDWMFRTSRKKGLQTYDEYWRRLCQYFELFSRLRVGDNAHKQMRRVRAFLLC